METDLRSQAQQQAAQRNQVANNGMRANAVAGMLYRMITKSVR
jgi:hypothetical protein